MGGIRIWHFAEKSPDVTAIIDPAGLKWSRGQVMRNANRLSRALQRAGIQPGDVAAILAPNSAEFLIAYIAATQVGLYVVPINWHLAAPEIRYILENSQAKALIAHPRFSSSTSAILAAMQMPPEVLLSIGGDIAGFYGALDESALEIDGSPAMRPVEGRVLGYTSATTGKPKGVLLPIQDAMRAQDLAISLRIAGGTRPEEHVFLCYSMLYHGAPLENAVTALHMGQVVILSDSLDPEGLLKIVETHRVTQAFIVPTMFARLLQLPESVRAEHSIASLQRVVHGGAQCPSDVKHRMIEWWGPILVEAYGSTEGSGTLVTSEDWMRYPGTVGKPMPGTRLKILGEQGEELPAGVVGNVYLTRFSGDKFQYLGEPEKTKACYQGEYFTVGDVGHVNEEGFLFLCDRKIDMISLGGAKVYPAEIESALIAHPNVVDCAVFGIPSPLFGEAIVALIQPSASAPPALEMKQELVRFLRKQLSLHKCPRYIEIVPDLGRDETGKIQKRRLREEYLHLSQDP